MPANTWSIGTFYVQPAGPNGYWSQPGGPGTTVFPQQVQANSDMFVTTAYSEMTGTYIGSCGHSFDQIALWRDHDYTTGMSVALICCPLCSVLFRVISPFEDAVYGTTASLQNAILTP